MKTADRRTRTFDTRRRGLLLAVAVAAPGGLTLSFAPSALAVDHVYTNASGGLWSTTPNWSQGVPPNGDRAFLNGIGTYSVTQNVNYSSPGLDFLVLNGGPGIGDSTVLSQTGNVSTIAGTEWIGDAGPGNAIQMQSAGTVTITGTGTGATNVDGSAGRVGLFVGHTSVNSAGAYQLQGGNLNVTGGEFIGYSGGGLFTQSNGANVISGSGVNSGLFLGYNPGSTGSYSLSGGSLFCNSDETIGTNSGPGTFTQIGGTNTLGSGGTVYIASYQASGTYTLSGGTLVASHVYVGAGVTGTLTVSGTGVLTTGSINAYKIGNNSVNLSGGRINTSQLFLSGGPSVFNWTSGTLNLTPGFDMTFDSAATPSSTGAAFGAVLTLGNNQTFIFSSGNEGLGGTGPFSLVLNSGSSHYVTNAITLYPTGTITQNSGSSLYYSTFTQAGGTVNGALQNQGNFIYQSGVFNGRLLNQGTVSLGPSFTAGNGIENDGTIALTAGQVVTVNGSGLDNLGVFSLSGGGVAGVGILINDYGGTMQVQAGVATIGNPAFNNNGALTVAGVLALSGSVVVNNGTITLNSNGVIRLNGVSNFGAVTLAGGAITGATTNHSGGIIQGGGVTASLTNSAGGIIRANNAAIPMVVTALQGNPAGAVVEVAAGCSLTVNNAWTNGGLVTVQGPGATLGGGTITNTGTIQGAGTISAPIMNSTGVIRAAGGELDLLGAILGGLPLNQNITTNGVGAQVQASAGNTVMYIQGLATNAGAIALSGGTFDNNNQPLSNTGSIEGNGVLRTGGLTIAAGGVALLMDANSSVFGPVTNAAGGDIRIVSNTTTFYGPVTNNGIVKVTSGVARFLGNGVSLTVGGTYTSDPSDNYFNGLATTATGAVTGGAGDRFFLTDQSAFTNAGAFTNSGALAANAITNSGTFIQTGTATYSGDFTNTAGSATLGGAQSWSNGTKLAVSGRSVTLASNPGSDAAYNLAAAVTPASGSATLTITGSATDLVQLRGLSVNTPGVGGSGLVVIGPAAGTHPSAATGFGGLGGSVRVYLGNGSGGAAPASRASVEALWHSAVFDGYWAQQNGFTTAVIRGITLANGVVANTARNGLAIVTSFDDSFNAVTYLGEDVIGDANGDGAVDSSDITLILRHLNKAPGAVAGEAGYTLYTWGEGDFNGDESVDSADVTLALSNLGKSYNPALDGGREVTAVPEPTGWMCVVGGVGVMARRRRLNP